MKPVQWLEIQANYKTVKVSHKQLGHIEGQVIYNIRQSMLTTQIFSPSEKYFCKYLLYGSCVNFFMCNKIKFKFNSKSGFKK